MSVDIQKKTGENLLKLVGFEALAFFKYLVYAEEAEKDGFKQIAAIFRETAKNEFEHGKIWLKHLENTVGSTQDNLIKAINNENEETKFTYPDMATIAKNEGYDEIAEQLAAVGGVEGHHLERFLRLYKSIKSGEVFVDQDTIAWKCRNCGHIHYGVSAPQECPACKHKQEHFERFADNY